MSTTLRLSALAGAIAFSLGGTAMANTNLDVGATGDVFINVVDTSNNTSFLFDTSVSQASFSATGNYTYNFASDPNYKAFVAGEGANDVLDYSVFSGTLTTGSPKVGTVLFTSNASPTAQTGQLISNALSNANGFLGLANQVTSTTTNSALLGSANTWGSVSYEQTVASNLGVPYTQPGTGIDALVGTALNFYDESSNALRGTTAAATTLSTLAGTWDYTGGVATYNGGGSTSPVPLPTSVLLLLSGLGLMGVVTRRGKDTLSA